ncbi:unnamed protein product, partial [Musa hybrid cultivar]
LGLGTQLYSNALLKLPYMRHPWEHVVRWGWGGLLLDKTKAANERRYFGGFIVVAGKALMFVTEI